MELAPTCSAGAGSTRAATRAPWRKRNVRVPRRRRPRGTGARSTSRLRTRLRCAAGAAPPSTALRVRSAAIQRRAEAGAAGACVSAAPAGVPRGRRAFKGAAKVAGKGTPLPGGALWAHFRKWAPTGHNGAT